MPAPIPYNGGQSRLEYFALNGNVTENGGLGRPVLITQSKLKYGKSFKNPDLILGSTVDKYGLAHTNLKADTLTPYRGKGTGDLINDTNTKLGITARWNYNGGDDFDINGGDPSQEAGSSIIVGTAIGRKKSLILNQTTWGYSPDQTNPASDVNWYKEPNTALNVGQVFI